MATPVIANSGGGLDSIAQLIQALSPQFGSGRGTTNTNTSANPDVLAKGNDLINQILNGVSPENLDALTANILERAKQTFAPANIMGNAAGVRAYSDTVRKQLQDEAMARATGEAMQARLQATATAQKTAAGINESQLGATKQTQQQTKTGATPAGKGIALGTAALYGTSLFKKTFPKDKPTTTDTTPETVGNAGLPSSDPANLDILAEQGMNNMGELALLPSTSTVPGALDLGGVDDAAAAFGDGIGSTVADTSTDAAVDTVTDTAANTVADSSTEQGGNLFTDFLGGDFGFADGGLVTPAGRRPLPGSYSDTPTKPSIASVTRGRTFNENGEEISGTGGGAAGSASIGGSGNTASFNKLPNGIDINALINHFVQGGGGGDSSPAGDAGASIGGPPSGLGTALSLGNSLAGPALGIGPVPGLGLAVAIGIAIANAASEDSGGLSGQSSALSLGGPANDSDSLDGANAANNDGVAEGGNTAANAAADAASSDSASSTSSSSDSSSDGTADGGDGSSSGDGGGGDGGGEHEGGMLKSSKPGDYVGKDKMHIKAEPGEYIIKRSVVNIIGEDFLDKLNALVD